MADFRDNWHAQLKLAVERAADEFHGDLVAGRKAVAQILEIGDPTLYQVLERKSGKKYPSAELMVMFEKKFGREKPAGWSSMAIAKEINPAPRPISADPPDITEQQMQLLQDFEMLIAEEQNAIRQTLREKAEYARKIFDQMAKRHGIPPPVTNKRVEETFGPAPGKKGPGKK